MPQDIPWPVLLAIGSAVVFMIWRTREDGKTEAKLKQAQADQKAADNVRAELEKQREKAEAAKSVGNGSSIEPPVTSVGLSDSEYALVFGHERPHSNS